LKNQKALYLLLSANAISHFAQGISMLAIPWYFAKYLGAASTFATIYSVATFITLFWGLYAGTLIDRFPRKNIFLGICALSSVVLIGVASMGYVGDEIPMFWVAFVFCFTLFNYNIHYPTLYAFGQEITEKENYSKTNSLLEVMGQSTNVLSGAMAVLLIEGVNTSLFGIQINVEAWPIERIFLMDGLTYIVAAVLIKAIKYVPTTELKRSTESISVRFKEGLAYLKERPLLFHFGNASYTVFIFTLISTHVLWPIYIDSHLGAEGDVYAINKVHYAIGAMLAGFFVSRIFRFTNRVFSIIVLSLIAMISFTTISLTQNELILYVTSFFLGISNAGIRIQRITYLFNHIPNNIIGRTNSVFQSINIFLRSIFLGIFSMAFFNQGSNIIWAMVIAAGVILISLIPLIVNYKGLKDYKKV
jgi:MFS family permease